jgi:hypothetical protein
MLELCNLDTESAANFLKVVGKKIMGVTLVDDELHLSFGSQGTLVIRDEGQSCCENRYITTDDKLDDYVGGNLLNIEVKPVPIPMLEHDSDGDSHDIEFVEVTTTKGSFVLVTHNEHNGYYGGFYVCARHREAS